MREGARHCALWIARTSTPPSRRRVRVALRVRHQVYGTTLHPRCPGHPHSGHYPVNKWRYPAAPQPPIFKVDHATDRARIVAGQSCRICKIEHGNARPRHAGGQASTSACRTAVTFRCTGQDSCRSATSSGRSRHVRPRPSLRPSAGRWECPHRKRREQDTQDEPRDAPQRAGRAPRRLALRCSLFVADAGFSLAAGDGATLASVSVRRWPCRWLRRWLSRLRQGRLRVDAQPGEQGREPASVHCVPPDDRTGREPVRPVKVHLGRDPGFPVIDVDPVHRQTCIVVDARARSR